MIFFLGFVAGWFAVTLYAIYYDSKMRKVKV